MVRKYVRGPCFVIDSRGRVYLGGGDDFRPRFFVGDANFATGTEDSGRKSASINSRQDV